MQPGVTAFATRPGWSLFNAVKSRGSSLILAAELLALTVLYGIFVVTDRLLLAGVLVVGVLWVIRAATARLHLYTALTPSVVSLVLLLPATLYASADWSRSLPKVYGMLLGAAVFYVAVQAVRTRRDAYLAGLVLALMALGFAIIGILGARWTNSVWSLPAVYGRLPGLIRGIPRAATGFNANGVAGALIFFVPVLLSLLIADRSCPDGSSFGVGADTDPAGRLYKPVMLAAFLLATATVLLTGSRGGLIGLAAGLWPLAAWRDRRWLWLGVLVAVLVLIIAFSGRLPILVDFAFHVDTVTGGAGSTVERRLELWERALYIIQDFPLTGVGVGTFDGIVDLLYPLFLVSPGTDVGHAHNELLQVAVDFGLPGLVAYVGLLSAFFLAAWRTYRVVDDPRIGALLVGLGCGMFAHQVFGLTDAFMLGTKPAVVMWLFCGLVAALYLRRLQFATYRLSGTRGAEGRDTGVRSAVARDTRKSSAFTHLLLVQGYWVVFSLLAVAVVDRVFLAVAVALIGGVVLGVLSVRPSSDEFTIPATTVSMT